MSVWRDIWPEATILLYVTILSGALVVTFLLAR
jgi:hypothetical protein